MNKIKVIVNLKKNVMDPEGLAVKNALNSMGVKNLSDVRIGKVFYLTFNGEIPERAEIEKYCDQLLANPVIEDFEIEY